MKYRADIDGLRAVAVLGVVIFHAFPAKLAGGFVGVDVFFVISGFLISGIILDQLDSGSFTFKEFYARRVRRIFPALLVVLAATLGIGWTILFRDEFALLGRQVAASAGFGANILFWQEVGYFDQATTLKPLLHLWSLGVEEQFYLVWPVLLLLCRTSRRRLGWMCAVVFAASLILNLTKAHHHPEAVFYLPQFRLWEFVAGAAVVVFGHCDKEPLADNRWFDRPWLRTVLSLAGLGLLAVAMAAFARAEKHPELLALVAVMGSAMLIYAGPDAWGNKAVLSRRPMRWIGRISYPFYLWHWPLISFLHVLKVVDARIYGLSLVVSLGLAWLTYALLETPVRRQPARRFALALCAGCFIMLMAGVTVMTGIAKPRLDYAELNNLMAARQDWDYPPKGAVKADYKPIAVYLLKGSVNDEVLYIGDSNMEQYAPRIAAVIASGQPTYTAAFLTKGGCRPIPHVTKKDDRHDCAEIEPLVTEYLATHPVKKIVIGGRWSPGLSERFLAYHFPGADVPLSDPRGHQAAVDSLSAFAASMGQGGRPVAILQNIPSNFHHKQAPDIQAARLTFTHNAGGTFNEFMPRIARGTVVDAPTRAIIASAAAQAKASVIDPVPALCGADACALVYDGNHYIYKDGAHLTAGWAARYATFTDATILSSDAGAGGAR